MMFTVVIAPHNPTLCVDDTDMANVRFIDNKDMSVHDELVFGGGIKFCSTVRDQFDGDEVGYIGLAYVNNGVADRMVAGSFVKL